MITNMIRLVCAHHEPPSFNHVMVGRAKETLTAAGQEVEISDLCAMGFDVLPPFAAHGVDIASRDMLSAMLDDYAERLRHFDAAEPLFFHPWSDYAGEAGHRAGDNGVLAFQTLHAALLAL